MTKPKTKFSPARLRRLIAATGRSDRKFAHGSGFTPGQVSQYLSGARSPSVDSLLRLARALGCGVEELCE